jgi:hypothetical protein
MTPSGHVDAQGAVSPDGAHLRFNPRSVSLIGIVRPGPNPCKHKPDRYSVCLSDSIPPGIVNVQEKDGFPGPFTFTVYNPAIAMVDNDGANTIDVTGLEAGVTRVDVIGDEGNSKSIPVYVTETDISITFHDLPANAAMFQIGTSGGFTSQIFSFPKPGPIRYHVSFYDYPVAPSDKMPYLFYVHLLDANQQPVDGGIEIHLPPIHRGMVNTFGYLVR